MIFIHCLIHDLRFGLRMQCKNSGFAFLAILTTALGIADVTIFKVVTPCFFAASRQNERLVRIPAPGK